jgi:hypothetical protein
MRCRLMSFARASLRCVPSTPHHAKTARVGAPARWEQLRADLHPTEPKTGSSGTPGLRREELFLFGEPGAGKERGMRPLRKEN